MKTDQESSPLAALSVARNRRRVSSLASGVAPGSRSLILAALLLTCGCQRTAPPVSQPAVEAAPAPANPAAPPDSDSAEGAANVVRMYYRAINERRYDDAYRLWASQGEASGKTLSGFRSGFDSTASASVELAAPGPMEGAAGSRYIEIPARVSAVATDGGRQVFTGSYVLRRAVVDGATAEQRAWRIYSAKLRRVP